MIRTLRVALLAAVLILAVAPPAMAYIGPGAGFALAGSAFAVAAALFSAILMLFTWPVRWAVRSVRGGLALARSRVKRFVILGLDGMDYRLTRKFMAEGKLPNLAALGERAGASNRWPAPSRPSRRSPGRRFKPASIRASTTSSTSSRRTCAAPISRNSARRKSGRPAEPSAWASTGCRWEGRRSGSCARHALLDPAGQTWHLLQRAAGADHFPARKAPRRAALGHVCPRPAGLARHVLLLQHPARRRDGADRRRNPPGRAQGGDDRSRARRAGEPPAEGRRRHEAAVCDRDARRGCGRPADRRPTAPAAKGRIFPLDSRRLSQLGIQVHGLCRFLLRSTEPNFTGSTLRPSISTPSGRRCPSATRPSTRPTWPSGRGRLPRWDWPKTPGR